jgi:hypothetical protein
MEEEETDNVSLNPQSFPQQIHLQQLVQQQPLPPHHHLLLHPHPLIYLHHQLLQRYLLTLVKLTVDVEEIVEDAVGMQIRRRLRLSLLPLLPLLNLPLIPMSLPLLNPRLLPTMEAPMVVHQLV